MKDDPHRRNCQPLGAGPDLASIDHADPCHPDLFRLGEYQRSMYARLRKGAIEYGDRSFTDTDPTALLREIQEELLDVSAWAFILWTRLARMKKALEILEATSHEK